MRRNNERNEEKKYDIDRLSQKELKDRIKNIKDNMMFIESKKGKISSLQLIKDYEYRLK